MTKFAHIFKIRKKKKTESDYLMAKKTTYTGLTDAEVSKSREQHGVNLLTPKEKVSLWVKFLEKFKDPLIIILLVAGVLSVGISFYEYYGLGSDTRVFFEPIGIFAAVLIATCVAFYFEYQAGKEFEVLIQANDDELVSVIRNGSPQQIAKKEVVVGDILVLSTGQEIPADAELLEASSMQVDESTLTGEPMCEKYVLSNDSEQPNSSHGNSSPIGGRDERSDSMSLHEESWEGASEGAFPPNHVMRGTKVMEGHGFARVFAVGDATENGKVFEAVQIDNHVKTPLNIQLSRLSMWITYGSYIIAGLIVVARLIVYFLQPTLIIDASSTEFWVELLAYILNTLMIAVTLIVVAVPEGLPMAVALSLAYSMRAMLKTGNLVRTMHACETMGATTVICTDKTGTLTQNQMQVAEMTASSELLYESIATNSTAMLDTSSERTNVVGNPTEGALLLWMHKQGIDYEAIRQEAEVLNELPFHTERKYSAVVVKSATMRDKQILYVKGAPEIVLDMCSEAEGGMSKKDIHNLLKAYQEQAMRTLGFAYYVLEDNRDMDIAMEDMEALIKTLHSKLKFISVAAISDPVRNDVPDAVKECLNAGIDVKIVTGDTPGTAREIGRQIGIWDDTCTEKQIITGPEFAVLSDAEAQERVKDIKIISRARPLDKKRLVEALQKNRQVVAVTGDGTNDAPALKSAHVGLSMGDGTSVAKEASDITIIDNSFSSITRAVMWGRSLYQNIQRFILFQMTVNVAACFIVLIGSFLSTESPLTVTQMLWVNLIMDTFAAMALASLPPSRAVMQDKPRSRKAFIISQPMWRHILGTGSIITLILLAVLICFERYNVDSMMDFINLSSMFASPNPSISQPISDYELSLFFTLFVMLQFWNMFNARAFMTGRSALHLKGCKGFCGIALLILIGQIFIVSFGGEMFNVTPLHALDWTIIIVSTSLVFIVGELLRMISRK